MVGLSCAVHLHLIDKEFVVRHDADREIYVYVPKARGGWRCDTCNDILESAGDGRIIRFRSSPNRPPDRAARKCLAFTQNGA